MSKVKYYSLDKILATNSDYHIIYGERSNGKTTAVLAYGLKRHIQSGYVEQLAIIRRWQEDFKGKNGSQMFEGINALGWVEDWTNGKYNNILYYAGRWYLAKFDEQCNKLKQAEEPFALAFSIASEEHYKSTSYPYITIILFDEFITRSYYLPDEFVKFQSLLSTIIRLRDDVKIFMCANTISRYCPYFNEMGLSKVKTQRKGTIDIYSYGDNTLHVAVEFSDFDGRFKKSNKYFAFDNPKLEMITNGSWEMAIYPHLPVKYAPKEIKYTYFINFNDELLQCEIIYSIRMKALFTFIHRKTSEIQENNKNIVFQIEPNAKPNYRRKINKYTDNIGKKIYWFFENDKVFYQSNEVGEIVRNYLMWCKKEGL